MSALVTSEPRLTNECTPIAQRYRDVRAFSEKLCAPLSTEDYVVQSMPDVSPTKWHLAHTSWFFETFLLKPHLRGYREFDEHFGYLFNSYYVAIGDRHCRQNRGLLSRPTVEEVMRYRAHVDRHMLDLLDSMSDASKHDALAPLIEIGLHHEQQHQELMLTDIKHVFWVNPLRPAYVNRHSTNALAASSQGFWRRVDAGLREIGHDGRSFAFDNESPRHTEYVGAFEIGSRLVTNGEYLQFIDDRGYERADLWLSLGWATRNQEQWNAPLYWIHQDGKWLNHTLSGLRPVDENEPVSHVGFFEADAFARWAGARLPTEAEWETVAANARLDDGNFVESERFHPAPSRGADDIEQLFGDVWEWTGSAYLAYPGYRPPPGALGEYNGKFMCNQFVLRGGSCATSRTHIRATYRNFFPPDARWQFTGIRLARSV